MNILLLVASPFAGYLHDVQGTYTNTFLILARLNFLGGVLFLSAKNVGCRTGQTPGAAARGSGWRLASTLAAHTIREYCLAAAIFVGFALGARVSASHAIHSLGLRNFKDSDYGGEELG